MKKLLIYSLFVIALASCSNSEEKDVISYKINLDKSNNKEIMISMEDIKLEEDTAVLRFVKMEPGHTANYLNYGLYVSKIRAKDKDGNEIEVLKTDTNTYEIHNAKNLDKIEYNYLNTWDDTIHNKGMISCVGTYFNKDNIYIINGGAFGSFKGYENKLIELEIIDQNNALTTTSLNETDKNIYSARNYEELYDSPIIVGNLDTASFNVNNTKFNVIVYNEQGVLLASLFSDIIEEHMIAVSNFVENDFPVKEYDFIFYIKDYSELTDFLLNAEDFEWDNTQKAMEIYDSFRFLESALEHKKSSFFCMSANKPNQKKFDMLDYCIHEFIHIYSPKQLSTDIVKNFNYYDPEISKHRWLYEGVIEYFNGLIKLQSEIIIEDEFWQAFMRPKIISSNYFPNEMTFTEFSSNTLKEPYKSLYFQSYQRGPVLALMLDIEIIRLTGGKKNLRDVFFKLYKESKEEIYTEKDLFQAFADEVDPQLMDFFNSYIDGNEELQLNDYMEIIGMKFISEREQLVPDISISAVPLFNYYFVTSTNIEGMEVGDKLDVNVFGRDLKNPFRNIDGTFKENNEKIELLLHRNGEEVFVKSKSVLSMGVNNDIIETKESVSRTESRFHNKWATNMK